jgi:hypothetical protein
MIELTKECIGLIDVTTLTSAFTDEISKKTEKTKVNKYVCVLFVIKML